jgi:hypothetical protein
MMKKDIHNCYPRCINRLTSFFISALESFDNQLMQKIVGLVSANMMTIFEMPSRTELGTE